MRWFVVSICVLATAAISGCHGGAADDADSDTVTETASEIDTTWDGGPLTPCEGDPPEGMVCVPGGTYLLGCMPYDILCEEDELPLVEVTLSPFWVDVYETTYDELLPFLNTLKAGYIRWKSDIFKETGPFVTVWHNYASICLGEDDEYYYSPECSPEPECNLSGNNEAAGGLSQLGARMYCEWRGKRLPTEAQWEAAARGQTSLIYPCSYQHLACWFGPYGCALYEYQDAECYWDECCLPEWTSAAGNCPSQWGAVQMTGNAAEWVLDRKDEINDGHTCCAEGCTDPEPRDGAMPVIKGGGTMSSLPETRISSRVTLGFVTQSQEDRDTGVRCVLPADGRAERRWGTNDDR